MVLKLLIINILLLKIICFKRFDWEMKIERFSCVNVLIMIFILDFLFNVVKYEERKIWVYIS